MIPRKISPWVALFCLLAMGGCQQADLHHGLEEMEADQVLNVLHQNGIKADKVKEVQGQEVSWKVSVPSRDLARARQILITHNMPRRKELGLSGVYKEKGLIPTPDEQKARYLLALKGEIINSLEKIPGVVDADVVLNIPAEDEFSELRAAERRPTASVVVRTEGDFIRGEEVGEGLLHDVSADDVGVGGWVGLNARLGDVDDGAILLEEVHLTDVGKLRKTQSLERLLEARLIAALVLAHDLLLAAHRSRATSAHLGLQLLQLFGVHPRKKNPFLSQRERERDLSF